jgi:acyl-[acyl-carrier-protein]-phospholipid O-acyltransferase/long-chain-fatty-acid--[acyl-carrier-protein] ligase
VVVGAEKLKTQLADRFTEKFGVTPLEGYGATELAPVVSFNIPNTIVDDDNAPRAKQGTIGRALPGICARIVDPDTGDVLDNGKPGLLLVKGPNVMEGYLDRPDLTMEAIRDGWYITGDIAAIDKQGFITLTDRLSRFSKIGGEMIPHGAIDEVIQNGFCAEETVAVTTAVPDERRGEKLVVIYNETIVNEDILAQKLFESSLPNLWKPTCFVPVREIPVLGSGKLNLKAIKGIAINNATGHLLVSAKA